MTADGVDRVTGPTSLKSAQLEGFGGWDSSPIRTSPTTSLDDSGPRAQLARTGGGYKLDYSVPAAESPRSPRAKVDTRRGSKRSPRKKVDSKVGAPNSSRGESPRERQARAATLRVKTKTEREEQEEDNVFDLTIVTSQAEVAHNWLSVPQQAVANRLSKPKTPVSAPKRPGKSSPASTSQPARPKRGSTAEAKEAVGVALETAAMDEFREHSSAVDLADAEVEVPKVLAQPSPVVLLDYKGRPLKKSGYSMLVRGMCRTPGPCRLVRASQGADVVDCAVSDGTGVPRPSAVDRGEPLYVC